MSVRPGRGVVPAAVLRILLVGVLAAGVGCSTGAGAQRLAPEDRAGACGGEVPAPFSHRTAEVNGVRLHYVIGGQGPPVVLLHGFPETWYTWRRVMPALARSHTVIAPDLRGVGCSSLESSGYDKQTMAGDVYQLVRSLGFSRVAVVGHDLGAMVAYAYAREHRDEVSHLVVSGVALPGFGLERLLDFREPGRGLPHLVFFMQPDAPELVAGRERDYLTRFLGGPSTVEPSAIDTFVDAYSRRGRLAAALGQYRALYQDADDNRHRSLPRLTLPVLALSGAEGAPRMTPESMRSVADDVREAVIPNAGHYLQEQDPVEYARDLLAFLDTT